MHFEVSRQKLQQWQSGGKLLAGMRTADVDVLRLGDRSDTVKDLQLRLNKLGEQLTVDGIFGSDTHAAVVAFQARNNLEPDGLAGKETMRKLKAATP
jgi:peptidoglycan hydrolase-like protein with peptidoglycan-binding domain